MHLADNHYAGPEILSLCNSMQLIRRYNAAGWLLGAMQGKNVFEDLKWLIQHLIPPSFFSRLVIYIFVNKSGYFSFFISFLNKEMWFFMLWVLQLSQLQLLFVSKSLSHWACKDWVSEIWLNHDIILNINTLPQHSHDISKLQPFLETKFLTEQRWKN